MIEESIRPVYLRRKRTERLILALLLLSVLPVFLPLSLGILPYVLIDVLANPGDYGDGSVVASAVAAIALLTGIGVVVLRALAKRGFSSNLAGRPIIALTAVALVAGTAGLVGATYANARAVASGHALENLYGKAPGNPDSKAGRLYDQRFDAAERGIESWAGRRDTLLAFGVVAEGLGLALAVGLWSARRWPPRPG